MEIFIVVLRSLLLTLACLIGILYIVAQFWQVVPKTSFRFKLYDWVVYGLLALTVGLGLQQYWGLGLFLPLVLIKYLAWLSFAPARLKGSGRWVEVEWIRMLPKGFNLPPDMSSQLARLPKDVHFVIPRIVAFWLLRRFVKMARKQMANPGALKGVPANLAGREDQAFGMFQGMIDKVLTLEKGSTEKVTLPFGLLKVTRL